MLIYLIRHGETKYNTEKRYQGETDIPLSQTGRAKLRKADLEPETVYVSPLSRAVETAAILFPSAKRIVVPDFREMSFGSFEGRNYVEMEQDKSYREWVEGGCAGQCPGSGGECKADFSLRTCLAFRVLVDSALKNGAPHLVIVAHGGTQMAVMETFTLPRRDYFSWKIGYGCGYILDASCWSEEHTLTRMGEIHNSKD